MKFLLLLIISFFYPFDTNGQKIYDLKEICDYTLECLRNNKIDSLIILKITKDEAIELVDSLNLSDDYRKRSLTSISEEIFDKDSLKKIFITFREARSEKFWKNCKLLGYIDLEASNLNGFIFAEPAIGLSFGAGTPIIKIGELLKTKNGWKIVRGPYWK